METDDYERDRVRHKKFDRPDRPDRPERSDKGEKSGREDRRKDRNATTIRDQEYYTEVKDKYSNDQYAVRPTPPVAKPEKPSIVSIKKLVSLIETKGFLVNYFFTYQGKYKYLELVSYTDFTEIILDLGTKYSFPVDKDKRQRHEFELTKHDIPTENTSVQNVQHNEADLRSIYREIDHIEAALQNEKELMSSYDRPISLTGSEQKTISRIGSNIRQMKRLGICMKLLPYKLAIFDQDCLCVLAENHPETKIESFFIRGFVSKDRRLFITMPLDLFYESKDIKVDIGKIMNQFYEILNQNQEYQTQKIQTMINNKRDIVSKSNHLLNQKKQKMNKIAEYQKLFSDINEKEKKLVVEMKEINTASPSLAITTESDRLAKKTRIEKELLNINKIRETTIKDMNKLKNELHELSLVIDNVLFDNLNYLMEIAKNFQIMDVIYQNNNR